VTPFTPEPAQPQGHRFRNGIVAVVTVLALLCAGFLVLDYVQGPKLSSATVDTEQVVAQADQQVRLFADQNLATVTKSEVSVAPSVPFTVTTQGQTVSVQFSERLHYSTRYTVRLTGVTSQYQVVRADMHYSFTTAAASIYYLDRADPAQGSGAEDSIIRTGLSGSAHTVVYSASHIQAFTVFPAVLAVVTINDDGTDSLSLVSLSNTAHIEPLALPTRGTIRDLQAESAVGVLGFIFTSAPDDPEYSDDLMTVDLTTTHYVVPVLGLDSKPLGVISWLFLSGTPNVVAQAENHAVLLIDSTTPNAPKQLGVFAALDGGAPDGMSIVVTDAAGPLLLTVANQRTQRLSTAGNDGPLRLLGDGTALVQQAPGTDGTNDLVYEDGTTTRNLFGKAFTGTVVGFDVSPNGQYLAINLVPDGATGGSDGYAVEPESTAITTDFIEIDSGALVRSVTGFDQSWSNGATVLAAPSE
jgi:hypothetical protein